MIWYPRGGRRRYTPVWIVPQASIRHGDLVAGGSQWQMIAGRQRSPTAAAAITTARHAIPSRRRRVVGAVNEGDVVLVEAERTTHDAVKTEHVAHQLHDAGKFPATHVRR